MIRLIDNSRFRKVTIADLALKDKDIASFKSFMEREEKRIRKDGIDKFDRDNLYRFPGENADFGFYRKAADSLRSLSDDVIDKAFRQADGFWSTTTNWRRIIFVFEDKTKLIVENSDYKPNYLFAPWNVDYEGLKFRSSSIQFGQTIKELTNGDFFGKTVSDKNYAIFQITDYLYRVKLQNTN
jgi:hypothetical protein